MKKKDIQEFVTLLTEEADAKGETKKLAEVIEKKLQEFIDVFTEFEMDLPEALHRILDSKKLELPKSFDVRVTNSKDLSPVFNAPKEIDIKRSKWMDELKDTMDAVKDGLDALKKKEMTLPKKAKDAIAVRLSDGEDFYKAITEVYQTAMAPGGGGSVPKITLTGGVQAVPIVNPDGTTIAGGSGSAAYSDSGGTDRKGLVDGDRHVQADVLSIAAGTNAIGKLLPPDVDVATHTNYKRFYYTNAGAVTDGIVWSPAAGKRWHVLWMIINVSADCTVTFEDDKSAGDAVVAKAEIAAKSGFPVVCPEKYPLASEEDAADLLITTTAGNVYVFGVGYEI